MILESGGSSSAGEVPVVTVSNTKYVSRNPLARFLLRNFTAQMTGLLRSIRFRSVLEVGCGEGILLRHLAGALAGRPVTAVDVDSVELAAAQRNRTHAALAMASAYDLPFRDDSFELVLCSEVLEHLARPEAALRELARVGSAHFLLSVPNEPLWRVLNLCRGSYVAALGNPPGHVRHWSRAAFLRLLAVRFEVTALRTPLPWLVALCRRRAPDGVHPRTH